MSCCLQEKLATLPKLTIPIRDELLSAKATRRGINVSLDQSLSTIKSRAAEVDAPSSKAAARPITRFVASFILAADAGAGVNLLSNGDLEP